MLTVELFGVDDDRRLFISPAIHGWAPLEAFGIDTAGNPLIPRPAAGLKARNYVRRPLMT